MVIFYTNNIADQQAILEHDEYRHCIKTMRKRIGDELHFIDGSGGRYMGQLIEINKKNAVIEVTKAEQVSLPAPTLHMLIAPTKNMSRLEWFLEKATEMGIARITPIICKRSERKRINYDRCQKILTSATKQCLRAWIPKLDEATKFDNAIDNIQTKKSYLAYYDTANQQLADTLSANANTTIIIGPEGDFTDAEIDLVRKKGVTTVNLGQHRLRTETAGLYAVAMFNQKNL